jgi:GNAT superfamily N-acetyltransferase
LGRLEIVPFKPEFLPAAAAMFVAKYQNQRRQVPVLPDRMESLDWVSERIAGLMFANGHPDAVAGLAALDGGQLTGYLGWWLVDRFRESDRRGAYCPVWAHSAVDGLAVKVYPALYRPASAIWTDAGCQVHAITLLAADQAAERAWFWNGFGMTVIDAIRPITPLEFAVPTGVAYRKASIEDAGLIAEIEIEHWAYYATAPIYMAPQQPVSAEGYREFICQPNCAVWLAFCGHDLLGYMRFEPVGHGAIDIVHSETTIANTGAYFRPASRGHGIGTGLLETALADYSAHGYVRCSVDFESFNPDGAAFWTKTFTPVCHSVTRRPEAF